MVFIVVGAGLIGLATGAGFLRIALRRRRFLREMATVLAEEAQPGPKVA
jgi:hypothetical protein